MNYSRKGRAHFKPDSGSCDGDAARCHAMGNVCRMTYGFELPSGWTGYPKPFLRVLSSPLHGLVENRAVGRIDAARFRGLVLDAEHHEWLVSLLQSNGTVINSISTRMNISRFMFTIKSDLVGQNSMFLTALSLSNQKA